MNKYEKDKLIGSGTFGKVWLVKSRFSRMSYVLKEIDLSSLNKEDRKRAFSEVTVLSGCNHENVVRYKDCIIDNGRLYIIMEYADNGDLHSAIVKQNGVPFSESSVILWFIQICLALQYIHYQNILHRDLKPKNIFLTRSSTIKVGDFGISRFLNGEDFATTSIGTPYYLSPEICQKKPYNHKSDMWALGCTLFELSALEHPFKAENFVHLINMILQGKRRELPNWSSSLIQELIENLLNTDPTIRSSADEILDYPSLQPYLSKYLLGHNSRKNASFLVSSRKIPQDELYKSSKEYSVKKRTASTLTLQQSKKRVISPGKEESLKANNMLVSSRKLATSTRKLSPSAEITEKQYEITYIKQSTRGVKLKDSSKNKVIMNLTYIVPDKSDKQKTDKFSEESQDNENILTRAIDYGYQSVETNTYSSDEKTSREQCWPTDQLPDHQEKRSSPVGRKEIEDSRSLTRSKLNSAEISFTHCQHGQCHQCILDMLWKNRIRGCVEDSVNAKEYNKLKSKLHLVFQGDLFKKIYLSLLHDWEENEINSSSASINNFIKNLNYEQVQNLPLMMQLIQLDLHMKPKDSENISLI